MKKDITLTSVDRNRYSETTDIINNSKVNFSNYEAIVLDNKLIGLFTLNKFIEDNITIHIELLEQFRTIETYNIIINGIIEKYGKIYPESEFFMININYDDEASINLFKNLNWTKTHEFDEIMRDEGGEFFVIYKKENPGHDINHINRKMIKYDKK